MPMNPLTLQKSLTDSNVSVCDCAVNLQVDQARAKGLYRSLHVADLISFLAACPRSSHDLVTVADTFVYLGDLADAVQDIQRVLQPGGVFVCSTEADVDNEAGDFGFVATPTGRYRHDQAYVLRLATDAGLGLAAVSREPIRKNAGVDVIGDIFVFQQPATP